MRSVSSNGGCFIFRLKDSNDMMFLTINIGWLPELQIVVNPNKSPECAAKTPKEFSDLIKSNKPCIISFKGINLSTSSISSCNNVVIFEICHPTQLCTTLVMEYEDSKDTILRFCKELEEDMADILNNQDCKELEEDMNEMKSVPMLKEQTGKDTFYWRDFDIPIKKFGNDKY